MPDGVGADDIADEHSGQPPPQNLRYDLGNHPAQVVWRCS